MKTIGISCILCVHIHRIISAFMITSTDEYTMMMIIIPFMIFEGLLTSIHLIIDNQLDYDESKGCELRIHARTYGSCIWKYYTSNLIQIGAHLYGGFNDRSLIMNCMCLHSLTPIVKSLTPCATFIPSKSKKLYIGIDYDTCIGQWYFIQTLGQLSSEHIQDKLCIILTCSKKLVDYNFCTVNLMFMKLSFNVFGVEMSN